MISIYENAIRKLVNCLLSEKVKTKAGVEEGAAQ